VLVGVLAWVVAVGGKTGTSGRLQLELLAVGVGELIWRQSVDVF
jgi:hypothetical protein